MCSFRSIRAIFWFDWHCLGTASLVAIARTGRLRRVTEIMAKIHLNVLLQYVTVTNNDFILSLH